VSDKIQGWLSPDVAKAMQCLIREVKPDVMIEIGVFAGKSLINAATVLQENGKGMIYGIDPWNMDIALKNMGTGENVGFWNAIDLDSVHAECAQAIRENALENVVLIRAPSERVHQLFQPESVEILYIDGGHSTPQSCADVTNYLPKVKRGGWVWLDDTDWVSVQKAERMVSEECELTADFGHACLYHKR
jgi:predicted O-methyltransferase YrrM